MRLTEEIRRSNRGLPENFRRSYISTVADTYRKLADLLLSEGRVLEAQQVLELLKIEELRGYNRDQRAIGRDIRITSLDAEQFLINKYGSLSKAIQRIDECRLNNCSESEIKILIQKFNDLDNEFKSGIATLKELVLIRDCNAPDNPENEQTTDATIGTLDITTNLENDGSADPITANAANALICEGGNPFLNPEDLSLEAKKILDQQPNTLLIYPFVVGDRVWLLWAGKDKKLVGREEIEISRQELATSVVNLRDFLATPDSNKLDSLKAEAAGLYRVLIAPIEQALGDDLAGIEHLVFALDEFLRYVPMSVLYDEETEQYLIEKDYTVTTILSAAMTDAAPQFSPEQANVLAAGVVSAEDSELPALKYVEDEINRIVLEEDSETISNDEEGIYPGQVFLNDQVTFENIQNSLFFNNYINVLHIATHGEFVPTNQGESYLLMGDGTELSTPKITDLGNAVDNIHLVVLSACETGLGGSADNGIEIAGINAHFLQGGAKAVLGTLWRVSDSSTSAFMQQFYANTTADDISKAEALRQAQLCFLNGDNACRTVFTGPRTGTEIRLRPGAESAGSGPALRTHPYYWAPFVLTGNGR
ncbi:MAG: CHAT domain-containing protein [Cyanobacteria bacterium P01_F01_bin.150]